MVVAEVGVDASALALVEELLEKIDGFLQPAVPNHLMAVQPDELLLFREEPSCLFEQLPHLLAGGELVLDQFHEGQAVGDPPLLLPADRLDAGPPRLPGRLRPSQPEVHQPEVIPAVDVIGILGERLLEQGKVAFVLVVLRAVVADVVEHQAALADLSARLLEIPADPRPDRLVHGPFEPDPGIISEETHLPIRGVAGTGV